jgi:hypothetical protein
MMKGRRMKRRRRMKRKRRGRLMMAAFVCETFSISRKVKEAEETEEER